MLHLSLSTLALPGITLSILSLCLFYKYCFILVQNEVCFFITWILAKYSQQQDGWSAACIWQSTGLRMHSKLWGLTSVIFIFWATLWVHPKELCRDFSVFVYQWGKWSLGKAFVCLFRQQTQKSNDFSPVVPCFGRMVLKYDLKPCLHLNGTWACAESACLRHCSNWGCLSEAGLGSAAMLHLLLVLISLA